MDFLKNCNINVSSRFDENNISQIIGTHNGRFHCDEALA
mgnify:CR=1 FL=1